MAVGLWLVVVPVAFNVQPAFVPRAAPRHAFATCKLANFAGEWEMDLKASSALGPALRELGLNRFAAALITRLGVSQTVTQDGAAVTVFVKTSVSSSTLVLTLDGSSTMAPGVTGGESACVSRWLDDERLETRQSVAGEGETLPPSAADADVFVTIRSLREGGNVLVEDVSVVRGGKTVDGTRAERLLRRA